MDSNLSFIREGKVHNIELGNTFRKRKDTAFHTVRYDFKPASADLTQQGQVDVGENNDVTITLPHTQGNSNIVYKGSKKPAQKECILIYDPATGDFTLERVTSQIQVKKTRSSGNINPQPPVLVSSATKLPKKIGKKPISQKSHKPSAQDTRKVDSIVEDKQDVIMPSITMPTTRPPETHESTPRHTSPGNLAETLSSSEDDSSSSSSGSSDEDDDSSSSSSLDVKFSENNCSDVLAADLQLSESGSDTD
ncbi:unnamed protein product [Clavelina lepadiformis]|uniref:Transcription elongation factor Eaf N-terminal domain-containing protein n=1 Tax=Clavelina lepadiformis TaxID=159417 RepID=A0ABP0FRM6_CLALP